MFERGIPFGRNLGKEEKMKIIDLSLEIRDKLDVPPSQARPISIEKAHRYPGHWQASWCSMSAHTASHVDSPLHVVPGYKTIGEISLEKVIGEAVVLDLTHKGNPNEEITRQDLEKFEGEIKEGDIVILRTDWGKKAFGTPDYYINSPYISPDAAQWLVEQKPRTLCFDFFEEYNARLKDFKPDDFVVHKIMLGKEIIVIEGLTNLDQLSKKRVQFFAAPLKIMDAEAAPVRIFAIEE